MAKQIPVIPAGVVCTVEALAAAGDFPIEGWVWPQSAKRQEAAGKLRAIETSDGEIVAWQRIDPCCGTRGESPKPVVFNPKPSFDPAESSITAHEMTMYAGRYFASGRSRTKGLSETKRKERKYPDRSLTEAEMLAGKRLPTGVPPLEDHVERVEAKVETFHTQRHTNNPRLMEKVRKQFQLMDSAAVALGQVQ